MGENSARNDAFIVVGGKVYLTRRQVPQHYPISEHTLAKLASERQGPRFFKPTDKALYLPADIEAWIEAAAVMPLAEPAPAQAPAPAQRPKPGAPKGRGRAKPPPRTVGAPGSSGRRLKSLPPTRDSWLRRHEQS
tara:strand:- start:116890 stop:117294 length:405 start_codon:yes stop_codon:yes gene_type:complete